VLSIGRVLKTSYVARGKLDWVKEAVCYWSCNLAGAGRHCALELHRIEVNYDSIAIIAARKPKAFGLSLAESWGAMHRQESE
jgi:hypothetical protein